jgi:hypothetical protein
MKVQKRKVHNLNWFTKNCIQDSENNFHFIKKPGIRSSAFMAESMLPYCGKVLTWDENNEEVAEGFNYCSWQDWMFEEVEIDE